MEAGVQLHIDIFLFPERDGQKALFLCMLIKSMTRVGELSNYYQLLALREERRDRQKIQDDVNDAKLKELVEDLDVNDRRLILCAKNIGAWLNVWGTMVTSTVLAAI